MLNYFVLMLLFFLIGSSLYGIHKLRRIHLAQLLNKDSDALYKQLEALLGLYALLNLKFNLPRTRGWAASPDILLAVAEHCITLRPETVVECSSGTSTVVIARCMQLNNFGRVYSLESDPYYAEKTRTNLKLQGLSDWAVVLDSPLKAHHLNGTEWPWYSEGVLPTDLRIDLLVIDGPPSTVRQMARYPAGPILFPILNSNGTVFLDDAARIDERKIVETWLDEFPSMSLTELDCEKGCSVLTKRK